MHEIISLSLCELIETYIYISHLNTHTYCELDKMYTATK